METLSPFYAFTYKKTDLLSFFVRCFPALFVLILLIFQQFLFSDFIDAKLSLFVYSLCFFALLCESFFLFFYKENQTIRFEPGLLLISAIFLISLPFFVQELSLFFLSVFLSAVVILSLLFLNKVFPAFLFFIYSLILLPVGSFALQNLSLKSQKTFILFSVLFLTLFFVFAFLLRWLLNIEAKALRQDEKSKYLESHQDISALLSLNFARKLKPFFNSFLKQWPQDISQEDPKKVTARLFSSQKLGSSFKKIQAYITHFLEYMDLDKKSFSLTTIDLHQLLEQTCTQWQDHPKKPKRLKIQNNIPPDSFFVKSSVSHLQKAFEHIIMNAFEALTQEKEPKLTLSAFKQKYWVLIEFLDNGHGVEEENLVRIFDPFFSTKEFGKGLRGFGLAYVQKMLQVQSGEVKAKRLEKGTLITLKLPLIQRDERNYLQPVKKYKKSGT